MSVEAMSWVLNHCPVAGTDKVILLGIANHASEDGTNAWPAMATLARYANVNVRNARRSVSKLAEAGFITIEMQEGGTRKTRADRRPNLYTIPGVPSFEDTQEASGDGGAQMTPRVSGDQEITAQDPAEDPRGVTGDRHGGAPAPSEPSLEPSLKDSPSADPEPDDPNHHRAHALAQFAYSKTPAPVTAGGFNAVMARCKDMLEAGWTHDQLAYVIDHGLVRAWTLDSLSIALTKAKEEAGGTSSLAKDRADGEAAERRTRRLLAEQAAKDAAVAAEGETHAVGDTLRQMKRRPLAGVGAGPDDHEGGRHG